VSRTPSLHPHPRSAAASSLLRAGPPASAATGTQCLLFCRWHSLSRPAPVERPGPPYRRSPSPVRCKSRRPGSRRLHAGHHLASNRDTRQAPSPEHSQIPSFRCHLDFATDASTAHPHQGLPRPEASGTCSWSPPDASSPAFSPSLTTSVFSQPSTPRRGQGRSGRSGPARAGGEGPGGAGAASWARNQRTSPAQHVIRRVRARALPRRARLSCVRRQGSAVRERVSCYACARSGVRRRRAIPGLWLGGAGPWWGRQAVVGGRAAVGGRPGPWSRRRPGAPIGSTAGLSSRAAPHSRGASRLVLCGVAITNPTLEVCMRQAAHVRLMPRSLGARRNVRFCTFRPPQSDRPPDGAPRTSAGSQSGSSQAPPPIKRDECSASGSA
jgi:hypothetical protein